MTNTVKLVWNGCDNYEFGNESVFTSREEFKPFDAVEISEDEAMNDEGEINDGVFCIAGGKGYRFYKAV